MTTWRLDLIEPDGRTRTTPLPYRTRRNAQTAGRRNTRQRPGRRFRTRPDRAGARA